MGYTHYASRRKRLTPREFKTAANDCQKVVEALCSEKGIRVQFDRDDLNSRRLPIRFLHRTTSHFPKGRHESE